MDIEVNISQRLAVSAEQLRNLYRVMVLARCLDDEEIRLKKQNKAFFCISGAGHEAVGAAFAHYLRGAGDWFYPYYRDRALCLGVGMTAEEQMLSSVGSPDDPNSGGRQMPSHWGHRRLHIVSQSSPTGTQFNQAVGCAEAGRYAAGRGLPGFVERADEVVYVSCGDGATAEGEFWEALNVAANLVLPVIFVVQDNDYAISVPVEVTTAGGDVGQCFSGVPGLRTMDGDGTDLLECLTIAGEATAHARAVKGPVLVRVKTTRPYSHSLSDDQAAYRTEEELAEEAERDCLTVTAGRLREAGVMDDDDFRTLLEDCRAEARAASDDALAARRWRAEEVMEHLYAAPDPSIAAAASRRPSANATRELQTVAQALNRTLALEMERDERIVIFGQDVADATREGALKACKGKGGVFKITHGLQTRFGSDRVFNTLLAEASIMGRAIGMATRGLRPIAEIQFVDFLWFAFMQMRAELATMRYRSAGTWTAPVIVRTPVGGYLRGGGIYHSQSPESIFVACPGLQIAYPSNAADAAGLLRAALLMDDPVVFMEHKHLYYQGYARSYDPGPHHVVPFGHAAIRRPGTDVTIVTWGAMVQKSLEAAETIARNRGIETEVIDLRTIRPLDTQAIQSSVRKTHRLLVVHEEMRTGGFGAEIAALAADECFEWLDAPVRRVAARDVWVSYAPALENAALPQTEDVLRELTALVAY